MLVSAVVVNWNGAWYLGECLESLFAQSHRDLEVIVVDNGSNDGSLDLLRAFGDRIRLIANRENRGFAGGANQGIRAARGDYIALLNNDARAEPSWLAELVAAIESAPDIGMCASKILFFPETAFIDKAGHLMYPDGLNAGRGKWERDRGQYDAREEALFPDGAAALYRKRMLQEIGLFDEDFFAYGDDADLGMRARLSGWRCLYVPSAVVYHRHSQSLGRNSPQKALLVERNRFWLAVKLWPWPLLLASPLFTAVRFFWQAYGALASSGSAGAFIRANSRRKLLATLLAAYASGLKGLPAMWRKRRQIRRNRRLSDAQLYRLLWRFRVSARELALRER